MRLNEAESVVESLLFVSGDAVSIDVIAKSVELDRATARAVVLSLSKRYEEEKRGIRIIEIDNSFQMCSAPENFQYLSNVLKTEKKNGLSQALLETLAIIAYKQPVTKAQIEEIRGVNSDHAVNRLIEKKLVTECGKSDAPGRPVLFGTTNDFLRFFGFKSIKDIGPLPDGKTIETSEIEKYDLN
ncbi:MAG: SMC-Scp complex subunit ScpB [Clostridia bacterium]|jgi:segregation and condensation protein B|nr:SMC-Scp complex subunit ScpB [Clostridia bacterium]MCI2001052.1 SMC-Scp complex subunit ScpB [Clostridia bacterium]MCI2015651.1 SMC-Scp complex subunit ScpB [Clostridia bacterium]